MELVKPLTNWQNWGHIFKILLFRTYAAPDAVMWVLSSRRWEKLVLNIHEESQRCPICFCRFQSSRLNHPELSDMSYWGRAETSYTTWVLKFFLLCLGLHTQQKACNEFNWLVKTRPADFWSQLFGHSPSTLSHVCSKMQAAQPRRFLMQPHTLPAMQYRKGIKRCFCKKKKKTNNKNILWPRSCSLEKFSKLEF